jgi:hypothetical protein
VDNTPGNPYVRSYDVASDGIVGKEVSKIDLHTWCYYGGAAELDHTGENVYVTIDSNCGGQIVSFSLSKSGELKYEAEAAGVVYAGLPKVSGNSKFAFAYEESSDFDCGTSNFSPLARKSNGALESISATETDPTAPAGYQYLALGPITNDPTDHLALMVNIPGCLEGGDFPFVQLASYTVDNEGDLFSANTWENMPALPSTSPYYVAPMVLNPASNILAVAVGTGTQFYHFNGAAPITPFTGIIGTSGYITAMAWDKDNHLYALNGASGRLHVYTATKTSVVESPGSPYEGIPFCGSDFTCPQSLIVRVP